MHKASISRLEIATGIINQCIIMNQPSIGIPKIPWSKPCDSDLCRNRHASDLGWLRTNRPTFWMPGRGAPDLKIPHSFRICWLVILLRGKLVLPVFLGSHFIWAVFKTRGLFQFIKWFPKYLIPKGQPNVLNTFSHYFLVPQMLQFNHCINPYIILYQGLDPKNSQRPADLAPYPKKVDTWNYVIEGKGNKQPTNTNRPEKS